MRKKIKQSVKRALNTFFDNMLHANVLQEIISHLNTWRDVDSLMRVCKHFKSEMGKCFPPESVVALQDPRRLAHAGYDRATISEKWTIIKDFVHDDTIIDITFPASIDEAFFRNRPQDRMEDMNACIRKLRRPLLLYCENWTCVLVRVFFRGQFELCRVVLRGDASKKSIDVKSNFEMKTSRRTYVLPAINGLWLRERGGPSPRVWW
jgi:hypothetical protein